MLPFRIGPAVAAVVLFAGPAAHVVPPAAAALAPPPQAPHHLSRATWEGKELAPDKGPEHGDAAATSVWYDVLRYHLALTIEPNDTTIEGTLGMVFASRRDGLATVVLDLANRGLAVSQVSDALGPRPFTHAGDSLAVTLRSPLADHAVDSLTIAYGGTPRAPHADRGLFWRDHFHWNPETLQNVNGGRVIASMSEPAYAKYWWPCKDRPDDKADRVTVAVTAPDTMVVASNGLPVGQTPAGPGWTTTVWRTDYPIASYLVSVAMSNYEQWQETCETAGGTTVPLHNFVFPLDRAEAEADLAVVCDMVEACEAWFGPYPFAQEKYGHAEFVWGGAMEHQTCTSLGASFLNGLGGGHSIILHELAHQWCGDSLTPEAWADIWLNEGFATYAEALWAERVAPGSGYAEYMADIRDPRDWVGDSPVHDPYPVFPGWVIYRKGAWILHMLRGRVGDDVFFPLLAEWTGGAGRPYGTVGTQEFVDLASARAGEDLDGFFWPYLAQDEVPRVAAAHTVADGPRGAGTRLTLDLRQLQSPLFDNVYPVRVTTAAGDTTLRVRLAQARATAVVDLPGAVAAVTVDPEGWLLWRPAALGAVDRLQVVLPNPVCPVGGAGATLRFRLAAPAAVTVAIHDARGALVHRAELGTVTPSGGYDEYAWDCRADGAPVPSGVYWAVLEAGGVRSVRKFTVLR